MMKLGIVPYLNCTPLVDGLKCPTYKAPPALLATQAAPEDLILAPIVQAFEEPGWHLMEGCGIGSFGPVDTVKLFFNWDTPSNVIPAKAGIQDLLKTLDPRFRGDDNIAHGNDDLRIYLDTESKTSVNLLKVLLQYRWEQDLREIEFKSYHYSASSLPLWEGARGRGTALLLIGDKAWQQPTSQPSIDLGEAWTEWTGKPFVWACWMSRSETTVNHFKNILCEQLQYNLEHLDLLAKKYPHNDCPDLLKYWRLLKYELGAPQKEAVALFQKYWGTLNQQRTRPLEWI